RRSHSRRRGFGGGCAPHRPVRPGLGPRGAASRARGGRPAYRLAWHLRMGRSLPPQAVSLPHERTGGSSGYCNRRVLRLVSAADATHTSAGKAGVMTVKIAVIYYSATGSVHKLAQAVAEGAEKTGAEVRLRRVAEIAPDEAIDQNPAWREHLESVRNVVPVASHDDLIWADAYAFGTPTRYGNVASQLKQFL